MKNPNHLAIIMDGNGRWAKNRRHNRLWGHIKGAQRAKKIIETSASLGINYLSLFTFSTENWGRPTEEITFLMGLLVRQLSKEEASLVNNNIKFHTVGDLSRLPKPVKESIQSVKQSTQHCTGMNLVFALSYGGRQEITQALKKIALKVEQGLLSPDDVTEESIALDLESSFLPDPDLIIRTSGEFRLSNFYLWQSAYSELLFVDKYWPDFLPSDLMTALKEYESRSRRFGHINDQRIPKPSENLLLGPAHTVNRIDLNSQVDS